MNATAMAAVNSGVAALSSEVKPACSVSVANEISVNGHRPRTAPRR
jgi:hypothetical protein